MMTRGRHSQYLITPDCQQESRRVDASFAPLEVGGAAKTAPAGG